MHECMSLFLPGWPATRRTHGLIVTTVGCASNTAFVIGMPTHRKGPGQQDSDFLQSEMTRRRFWGCYVLSCFQAWTLFPKTPSEAILNLPLPCRDDDFETGLPFAPSTFTLKSEQAEESTYAELIKVIALWSAVESLIKQPEPNLSQRIADIQNLDARIEASWARVPSTIRVDANTMSTAAMDHLPVKLLVQVMYHQCICALHSSIVPLFSWSKSDDTHLYARQVSGQIALDGASTLSSLLEAALSLNWDASRLPAFIGYAAYCACAIQLPFLWCHNQNIKQRTVRNVLTNLRTMHVIGAHWKNIHILVSTPWDPFLLDYASSSCCTGQVCISAVQSARTAAIPDRRRAQKRHGHGDERMEVGGIPSSPFHHDIQQDHCGGRRGTREAD